MRISPFPWPQVSAGGDQLLCAGESRLLRGTLDYGTPPFTIAWSPSTGLDNPSILTPLASPIVTTLYALTVTDAHGCQMSDTVLVEVRPRIYPDAGPDLFICKGEGAILGNPASGGTPPFTYVWSPADLVDNPSLAQPTAHPPADTVFIVAVTDANGCTAYHSALVTVLPVPEARAGGDTLICRGASLVIGHPASGGLPPYTYAWDPPDDLSDATAAQPVARPMSNATYILTVTDARGCTGRDTIHIEVALAPEARAGADRNVCPGQGAVIGEEATGGLPPISYRWTPAAGLNSATIAQPTARPAVTTMYHVAATDRNGCTGEDSVLVTVVEAPVADAGPDAVICAGESARLGRQPVKGTPPYAASWKPDDGSLMPTLLEPDAHPDRTTIYEVTITDANGCTDTDSVLVVVLPSPPAKITAKGPTVFCLGDSVVLEAAPQSVSFRWEGPGASARDTTNRFVARASGLVRLVVTDSNGCRGMDSIRVEARVGFEIGVAALGPPRFCEGDSVALEAQSGYSGYEWTLPDSSRATGRRITARVAGRYTVTARDTSGCAGMSKPFVVTVNPLPVPAIAGPLTACAGSTSSYTAGSPLGIKLAWEVSGGSIESGAGTGRITVRWAAPGSGWVKLTVTADSSGCSGSKELAIAIATSLSPFITGPATICEGDTALLDAGEGYAAYEWTLPDASIITGSHSIPAVLAGAYRVRVTDDGGCTGTSPVHTLAVLPRPSPLVSGPAHVCEGDSATLDAGAGFASYDWTLPDGSHGSTHSIRTALAGAYRVAVSDTNGCTGISPIYNLDVSPLPRPIIAGPAEACEGDPVGLDAGAGYASYEWTLPDSSRQTGRYITPLLTGAYRVRVTDSLGCAGDSPPHAFTRIPSPEARIAGPPSACIGTDVSYACLAQSGATYDWTITGGTITGGAGTDAIVVCWTSAGQGLVALAVSRGICAANDTMRVTVDTELRPVISGPAAICEGDSAVLDAGAGYASYEWTLPGGGISTAGRYLPAIAAGAYSVTVRDAGGCSGRSLDFTLTVHPRPVPAISGPSSICEGDTAVLDAGTAGAAYRWAGPGVMTADTLRWLAVRLSGVYDVTVTSADGCSGTASHALLVHPLPAKPVVTRNGNVLRSTPAQSHQWYLNGSEIPGAVADSIHITATGLYTVRITDVNGCTAISDPYEVLDTQSATAVLSLPDIEAAPGERITVPIRIDSWSNPGGVPVDGFSGTLIAHRDLLYPIEGTSAGIVQGSERMVPVQISPADTTGTLVELRFLVMLGPVDTTSLRLEGAAFGPGRVVVTMVPGRLRVIICREGGERLFDSEGRVTLTARPNPFNASTSIEYEVIEAGATELSVLDLLGKRVALLYAGVPEPGRYRLVFDASALSSGTYLGVLRTPTVVATVVVVCVK